MLPAYFACAASATNDSLRLLIGWLHQLDDLRFEFLRAAIGSKDSLTVDQEQPRNRIHSGGLIPQRTRLLIGRHQALRPRKAVRLARLLDRLRVIVKADADDFESLLVILLVEALGAGIFFMQGEQVVDQQSISTTLPLRSRARTFLPSINVRVKS